MLTPLPRYPALYQANTRVWLTALSRQLGRPATLDDIPDEELNGIAAAGFHWVWMLGVWQTGPAARAVSLSRPEWLDEYRRVLPDFTEADVAGSCFAVRDYRVHDDFGGDAALQRLRLRLHERALRLMLDFVPNHVAPDHPWVDTRPHFFIEGDEERLRREPRNYARRGARILAYGRDPHFDGWPDTLQLDYSNREVHAAMTSELLRVASLCDGVRCDMAMLLLPEIFEKTWGRPAPPFWPGAIAAVRERSPDFLFLAEVYWDLEWTLHRQGFHYCYDKRLYDRLRGGDARSVRDHLSAGLLYQDRLARFLENHDEPRAATVFPRDRHKAAAVLACCAPGLRFFHMGQLEGRRVRISVHLGRAPDEPSDPDLRDFYLRLLRVLQSGALREGDWRLHACHAAWDGNGTHGNFVVFSWAGPGGQLRVVAVNHSESQSQCYVRLPELELDGAVWRLNDLMGPAAYVREGSDMASRGLYLDMPAWGHHVFALSRQ